MPTIALVDDDRNILDSVAIALEGEGYRVQTYTDGSTALDGLKSAPPDLAIFDIKMPRMDGMELLRRFRQKSDVPVIFLTSKDEEIDELFGLKMGADDFIRKPFSQRLLVERVKAKGKEPSGIPFLDLMLWKGRTPSAKAQFCTEHLKMSPIRDWLKSVRGDGEVDLYVGIRAGESLRRSKGVSQEDAKKSKGMAMDWCHPLCSWLGGKQGRF